LIKETCALTHAERQLVKTKYAALFGHEFVFTLKKEIGGLFLQTMLALFEPPYEYEAGLFYDTIKVFFLYTFKSRFIRIRIEFGIFKGRRN
jgi:hypothetical protein